MSRRTTWTIETVPDQGQGEAHRNRVSISLGKLRHNVGVVKRLAGAREVIAVVKADAYGMGLERCAQVYHQAGIRRFAVATSGEGRRLHDALPDAKILLLAAPLPGNRQRAAIEGFEVCCSSTDEIRDIAAADTRQPVGIHLFIDTGMGRNGCLPAEVPALAAQIRAHPNLRLAGVGSHYPDAADGPGSVAQERRFAEALRAASPLPPGCLIHLANSEGLVLRPAGAATAVRVGILLAGITPPSCPELGLQQALRWEAAVTLVKKLPAGHGVSYSSTRVLDRETRVALVPVGYADGYPLAASNRGQVLIRGVPCPILGRVTMDYLIVDSTDLPGPLEPGETVELLGPRYGVAALAARIGTIPYDVLCGLRGRCEVVSVA